MPCAVCHTEAREVARSREVGADLCLSCYLARVQGPCAPASGDIEPEPERRPEPGPIARVVGRMEAHALPIVAIGLPGRFGSYCPLCPTEPGPFSGYAMRVPMVVLWGPGGVTFDCANDCDPEAVAARLAGPPTYAEAA